MNFWQRIFSAPRSPPQVVIQPESETLSHFLSHPNPGIVTVESVLPPPAIFQGFSDLTFLAAGHQSAAPTRTFDRGDRSLIENAPGPEFFKPNRDIQHV